MITADREILNSSAKVQGLFMQNAQGVNPAPSELLHSHIKFDPKLHTLTIFPCSIVSSMIHLRFFSSPFPDTLMSDLFVLHAFIDPVVQRGAAKLGYA